MPLHSPPTKLSSPSSQYGLDPTPMQNHLPGSPFSHATQSRFIPHSTPVSVQLPTSVSDWSASVLNSLPNNLRTAYQHSRSNYPQPKPPTIIMHPTSLHTMHTSGSAGVTSRLLSPTAILPSHASNFPLHPAPSMSLGMGTSTTVGSTSAAAPVSAAAAEELSSTYQALLARVSLQSSELAALQSELSSLQSAKTSKEELLKACAKGLEQVWKNLQQDNATFINTTAATNPEAHHPSHASTTVAPSPSLASNKATSQLKSLLSLLQAGHLSSEEDVSALFAAVSLEVSAVRRGLLGALSEAEKKVSTIAREASAQRHVHTHLISVAFAHNRKRALTYHILSAWRKEAARRLQLRKIEFMVAENIRLRRLRTTYYNWKLQLLQRSRDSAVKIEQKLAAILNRESVTDATRTSMRLSVAFFVMVAWRDYVRRLRSTGEQIRANRAKKYLAVWTRLTSRRRDRAEILGRLLKRGLSNRLQLAFSKWSKEAVQNKYVKLQKLAGVVETMEGKSRAMCTQAKARMWLKWQKVVLQKRWEIMQKQLQLSREQVQSEVEKQDQSHQETVEKLKVGFERTLAAEVARVQQEEQEKHAATLKQVTRSHEKRCDELRSEQKEQFEKYQSELATLQQNHTRESNILKSKSDETLSNLQGRYDKDIAHWKDQVDELRLTQKHVILEMKHQEHVHSEYKKNLAEKRRVGVNSGVERHEENVTGVFGHLPPTSQPPGSIPVVVAAHPLNPSVFTAYPNSIAPAAHVDPYLNSPVYHHHIQREITDKHKAELVAAQANEKALMQQLSDMRLVLEKTKLAYQTEHKALKSLKSDLNTKLESVSRNSSNEVGESMKEQYRLREEVVRMEHQSDLSKLETKAVQHKLDEIVLAKQALQIQLEESNTKLELASQKHAEAEQKLATEFSQRFANLQKENQEVLEKMQEETKQEKAAQQNLFQTQMDALKGDGVERVRELEKLYQERLSKSEAGSAEKVFMLTNQHERDVETMRSTHVREMQLLRENTSREYQSLLESSQKELQTLLETTQKERAQLEKDYATDRNLLLKDHATDRAALIKEFTQERDQLIEKARRELEATIVAHTRVQEQLQTQLEHTQLKAAKEFEQLQAQYHAEQARVAQLEHRLTELGDNLSTVTNEKNSLDTAHASVLDRNRKLAAALVEHHHNGGMNAHPSREDHTHTHVAYNEASVLAAKAQQQMERVQGVRTRTSSNFKPVHKQSHSLATIVSSSDSNNSSSAGELEQAFGAAAGLGLSSSGGGAGTSVQHGMLGFGAVPASSAQLRLTPITQLAFSPPATPPLTHLQHEPWPSASKGQAEAKEPQTDFYDGTTASAAAIDSRPPLSIHESPLYQQQQAWLRSPLPSSLLSPAASASLLSSPVSELRYGSGLDAPSSASRFQPHSSFSAASTVMRPSSYASASSVVAPVTSGGYRSANYNRMMGLAQTDAGVGRVRSALNESFTSRASPLNRSGQIDVSNLFQRGMQQY